MPSRTTFEFLAGPYGPEDLAVMSFTGTEVLSKPYRFDVLLASRASSARGEELLGAPARLVMHGPAEPRVVSGMLAAVEPSGAPGSENAHGYAVRLVPALWLLGRKKQSRVFQNRSTPEIVAAVLEESRIKHVWKLFSSYPRREYCLQYQETDLRFVSRLLAEAGIFFFFRQPAFSESETETLVMADAATQYEPIAGAPGLPCRDAGEMVTGEHIRTFALRHRVRAAETTLKGFDFKRPAFDLQASSQAPEAAGVLEGLRCYEHDEDLVDGDINADATQTRLEQLRRDAHEGSGTSSCKRFMPGAYFEIEDHTIAELNRRYAIVAVEHRGQEATAGRPLAQDRVAYENRFRVVPADVPSRPKRPRRRVQQVMETATVVGPAGEEIHTDAHGRIRVQFHWDREGRRNETSSCWIRTMQAWAGAAWGAQFVPRVGMEVVVSFMAGDVDRPMVLGAVYNGVNPTPFALPASKTQSGIRTRSSPGGGGFNELRFEDAAGTEQVYVHAQRNFDEVVESDHTRTVRGLEVVTVDKSRMLEVAEDNIRTVLGNEVVTIQKNFILHIAGKQLIQVDGGGAGGSAGDGSPGEGSPGAPKPASALAEAAAQIPEEASPEPLSAEAQKAQKVRSAKLSWLSEQLTDEAYSIGQIVLAQTQRTDLQTEELARGAAGLKKAVGALSEQIAAGAPGEKIAAYAAVITARAATLDRRARLAGEALKQGIEDNQEPVGPLARLQAAAIEQLQANAARLKESRAEIAAIAAEAAALAERARDDTLGGGSGSGGGGGTSGTFQDANVTFKDYRDKSGDPAKGPPTGYKGSKLEITGGGEIVSDDGFKISCGGSTIEITPGSIAITSSGPITLNGSPIKLNC